MSTHLNCRTIQQALTISRIAKIGKEREAIRAAIDHAKKCFNFPIFTITADFKHGCIEIEVSEIKHRDLAGQVAKTISDVLAIDSKVWKKIVIKEAE
ncbi:MAG: hypothetical protein WC325_10590 [Candidatus Bathyarchaeia archaeon]|jgi:hypothetical protein